MFSSLKYSLHILSIFYNTSSLPFLLSPLYFPFFLFLDTFLHDVPSFSSSRYFTSYLLHFPSLIYFYHSTTLLFFLFFLSISYILRHSFFPILLFKLNILHPTLLSSFPNLPFPSTLPFFPILPFHVTSYGTFLLSHPSFPQSHSTTLPFLSILPFLHPNSSSPHRRTPSKPIPHPVSFPLCTSFLPSFRHFLPSVLSVSLSLPPSLTVPYSQPSSRQGVPQGATNLATGSLSNPSAVTKFREREGGRESEGGRERMWEE